MDDARLGIRVQGLTEVVVPGFSRALSLVESGNGARAVGATKLNEYSSRSHTIVRVLVETRGPPAASSGNGGNHVEGFLNRSTPQEGVGGSSSQNGQGQGNEGPLLRTALLHWVDLAGSERLAKTGSTGMRCARQSNVYGAVQRIVGRTRGIELLLCGCFDACRMPGMTCHSPAPAPGPAILDTHTFQHLPLAASVTSNCITLSPTQTHRFIEGTSINLSLLMLGSVIARLAENASRAPGKASSDAFIPYRNSKLTRLLQPCLGGNARTALVATINPSHRSG